MTRELTSKWAKEVLSILDAISDANEDGNDDDLFEALEKLPRIRKFLVRCVSRLPEEVKKTRERT